MADEFTLKLNDPLTEEEWDLITDADFDNTPRVMFHTKHGKDVEYVKVKHGRWINGFCSNCKHEAIAEWDDLGGEYALTSYCPFCGAEMRVEE